MKMRRFNTSFEFGEVTPKLQARTDLPVYNKGLVRQQNMYSLVHGGSTRRRGTLYLGPVRNSTRANRLIPYTVQEDRRFLLVIGADENIPSIMNVYDVEGDGWVPNANNTGRLEIHLPYSMDIINDVKYTQAGATMILTHTDHKPRTFSEGSNWALTPINFEQNAITGVTFENAYIKFRIVPGSSYFREGEKFIVVTDANGNLVPPGKLDPQNPNSPPIPGYVNPITKMDLNPNNRNRKDVTISTAGNQVDERTGAPLLNGRQLTKGDRVLLKDNTDRFNGVWIVNAEAGSDEEEPEEPSNPNPERTLSRNVSPSVDLTFTFGGGEVTPAPGATFKNYVIVTAVPATGGGEGGEPAQNITLYEGQDYTRNGNVFQFPSEYAQGYQIYGKPAVFTFQNPAADSGSGPTAPTGRDWYRAPDFRVPSDFTNAVVRVVGFSDASATYYRQIGVVNPDLSGQVWERFDGVGNGQIIGVQTQDEAGPPNPNGRIWTIECVVSSSTRQEWKVTSSDNVDTTTLWQNGSWPSAVTFFEQRLFFGGSRNHPQHIWASCAGDYFNMTVGSNDNEAVVAQIAGNDYCKVEHLVSARQLIIMTTTTEYSMAGPNGNAISGISSNIVKDHTRSGSSKIRPVKIGAEIIFAQQDRRKIRGIQYSLTEDAFLAPDISIFAEHLSRTDETGYPLAYTDMTYAQTPDMCAWLTRSDGKLISMLLSREFEITAWAKHNTDGIFESVCAIPGPLTTEVYMVVARTINGQVRRYLEKFDYTDFDIVYTDCAKYFTYQNPTVVVDFLNHLEGKTVQIVADGKVHPPKTVVNGQLYLDYPAYRVIVGLGYPVVMTMMPQEFGDSTRTTQAMQQTIVKSTVRFQGTGAARINEDPVIFREVADTSSGTAVYSGDYDLLNLGWDDKPKTITIDTYDPVPITVLGIIIESEIT